MHEQPPVSVKGQHRTPFHLCPDTLLARPGHDTDVSVSRTSGPHHKEAYSSTNQELHASPEPVRSPSRIHPFIPSAPNQRKMASRIPSTDPASEGHNHAYANQPTSPGKTRPGEKTDGVFRSNKPWSATNNDLRVHVRTLSSSYHWSITSFCVGYKPAALQIALSWTEPLDVGALRVVQVPWGRVRGGMTVGRCGPRSVSPRAPAAQRDWVWWSRVGLR
ncbi:hypothetical protein F5144DRAFT_556059 [Chaetomium tenue]|uniref:Uncharacterized protein n=1 Tax=Chaetomium tenue TaxID=1854479 RepID=A0ACB7PRN8_9PEZI|nr:hypothetical protein F5144DRAFT_556059 [Chaetomium globosum]